MSSLAWVKFLSTVKCYLIERSGLVYTGFRDLDFAHKYLTVCLKCVCGGGLLGKRTLLNFLFVFFFFWYYKEEAFIFFWSVVFIWT